MIWNYYAALIQIIAIILLFSFLRLLNLILIWRRSLYRSFLWIYVLKKYEGFAHGTSAILTMTVYHWIAFMTEVV